MANKHMKRCPIISKMQIKTTVRNHLTSPGVVTVNKTNKQEIRTQFTGQAAGEKKDAPENAGARQRGPRGDSAEC